MNVDRSYRLPRLCPRGWVELRHYSAPSDAYPLFDVVVEMNLRSADCRIVIYGLFGVIHTECCLHPVKWGVGPGEELSIMAKFVRQHVARESAKRASMSETAHQWAESHPAIWEYLTLDVLDDGKERLTSMLCVFVEGGLVKVALQDRQEAQSLWVTSQSIPEALDALEARLQAGDGDWRQSRGAQGQGGFKKRR